MVKRIFIITILFFLTYVAFYILLDKGNSKYMIPLPKSAKYIAQDKIIISFPYYDKSSNDVEQWSLDRDSSNNLILNVRYKNKLIASFHIYNVGINPVEGELKFNSKTYSVKSVTLNNDMSSGWVYLQKK